MPDLTVVALLLTVIMGIIQLAGGGIALLFGHRLPWLWFTLAVYAVADKAVSVMLYKEIDAIRWAGAIGVALLAAGLALLAQRRFPAITFILGGFIAGGILAVMMLGPLLNPAPEWLALTVLAAAGIAGAVWTQRNPAPAGVVLSALVGAAVFADYVVDTLNIEEAARFQVYALLALAGIGVQVWLQRRPAAAVGQAKGA